MTNISIDLERIPRHIAIIMDGNGRWATQKNKPRTYGHQAGVDALRKITTECSNLGVKYLTVYTFSTENWNRPSDEVTALMGLVLTSLEEELFMKNNIRFRVIGDLERLPQDVRKKLDETIQNTSHNDSMTMVIALSYSSKWEITSAVREIASKVSSRGLNPSDINEETISQHLLTNFMPDPDLLIRTGGELRISNYLLWQIAYAELYFCDTYWPDFDEECLRQAIANYQNRQRRFGKTNTQVSGKISTLDASR